MCFILFDVALRGGPGTNPPIHAKMHFGDRNIVKYAKKN